MEWSSVALQFHGKLRIARPQGPHLERKDRESHVGVAAYVRNPDLVGEKRTTCTVEDGVGGYPEGME